MTIDRREAQALERILSACESTALEPVVCSVPLSSGVGATVAGGDDALALYDDNENERITCAEARLLLCARARSLTRCLRPVGVSPG